MKNEEKIAELLAESLKKQDQMMMALNKIVSVLENHTGLLVSHNNKLDDLKNFEERLRRLEKHTGLI